MASENLGTRDVHGSAGLKNYQSLLSIDISYKVISKLKCASKEKENQLFSQIKKCNLN